MKLIRVVKLGKPCGDIATGLSGQMTHWIIGMSHSVAYLFQPRGLNPKDGQPVEKIHLDSGRVKADDGDWEEVEVPVDILGTQVTDKASGFSGMATALIMHSTGCFHVQIQPSGVIQETNSPIERRDFALVQCEGEAIPKLDEKEEKRKRPSPDGSGLGSPFSRDAR